MKIARTEILIPAPPALVYATLIDLEHWPDWNPSVRGIEGEPRPGARLRLRLAMGRGGGQEVRVVITRVSPDFGLEWRGGAPGMPWLLDVHHAFRIEEGPGGRTRFVHEERFSGLIVPLIWPFLRPRVMPRYHATNEGLRAQCAAKASS